MLTLTYLIIAFYAINASAKEDAINMGKIAASIYFTSLGLFVYITKNLTKDKPSKNWIILIGPMFAAPLSMLQRREATLTDFGWVVKGTVDVNVDDLLLLLFIIFYFLLAGINILNLIKKASKVTLLKRKYLILLGSLLINFIGVFGANALMVFRTDVPHVAGLLYFFILILMWYALKLRIPGEINISEEIEMPKAISEFTSVENSYKRFLDKFLQVAATDELGLKVFDFLEYLDKTRLSDVVTYDKLRIILKAEKLENIDNIQALDRTMDYLEKKEWGHKLAQAFIDVIDSVFQSIRTDAEKTRALEDIIISRQGFLKKTDTIYGLSQGRFLELIQPDNSLSGLPEWSATMRLYIRLLLPIRGFIMGPIKAEFLKKIRSIDILKFLEVSEYGEIEHEAALSYVESLPEKQRTDAVRESFSMLLTWLMQKLAEVDPSACTNYLRTIRRIVKLNGEVKGVWRTYNYLVERATRDLGRESIRDLVLAEGYSYVDLNAFSSTFGLSHDRLAHNITLFEYDPRYPYERYVELAMREAVANTERCTVFTRIGSKVLDMAEGLGDVELKIMATIGTLESGIPFNDTSRLLDIIGRELESELETWVLFDNVSDLVLAVGFEEAYFFIRRVIDVAVPKRASLILLMNKGAHEREIVQTFEGLSTRIIEVVERPRLVK